MVAMACETRYCRGGTATGSVDHVGARRQVRCRQSPANGPSRFYLVGRYYDLANGAVPERGPGGATDSGRYIYVSDDPVNQVDPLGVCPQLISVTQISLSPCSQTDGGSRYFINSVGTVEGEQSPTGRLRFTLHLSHLSEKRCGWVVTVTGEMWVNYKGNVSTIHYSPLPEAWDYSFHFSAPSVSKGAQVIVVYVGEGSTGEAFDRYVACVTVLGHG